MKPALSYTPGASPEGVARKTLSGKVRNTAKTRVQLDLSPRALDRLKELQTKTEATSYAEVVKNALKLYDGLIEEIERGAEFMIKDRDGNIVPFRIFL